MTIPIERTRAVLLTRRFLYDLLRASDTPRVPRSVRERASRLLRHYPGMADMIRSAEKLPDVWEVLSL